MRKFLKEEFPKLYAELEASDPSDPIKFDDLPYLTRKKLIQDMEKKVIEIEARIQASIAKNSSNMKEKE